MNALVELFLALVSLYLLHRIIWLAGEVLRVVWIIARALGSAVGSWLYRRLFRRRIEAERALAALEEL